MESSLDELLEKLGFGKFSLFIIAVNSVFLVSEACEVNLISIITPILRCKWNLTWFQTSSLSSSVILGMSIGSLYWGFISDKHGRKVCIMSAAFIAFYFGALSALTTSYVNFLFVRFLVGFGVGSASFNLTYVAEFISAKYRGRATTMLSFAFAIGSVYVAVTALLLIKIFEWRIFILVSTVPPLIFLLLSPLLPKSIRYLQACGQYDDIIKIINRISIMQNVSLSSFTIKCEESLNRGSLLLLFSKQHRWRMLVMILAFITAQCGYFGLIILNTHLLQTRVHSIAAQNITNVSDCHQLNDSDYIQNLFVVFAELPGVIMAAVLVDKVGRKSYIIPAYTLAGACYITLLVIKSETSMTVVMFILRFFMIGLSSSVYVYITELFPTVIRALSLGVALSVARFFLFLTPYLIYSLGDNLLLPTSLVFATFCFSSAISLTFLPETRNQILDSY